MVINSSPFKLKVIDYSTAQKLTDQAFSHFIRSRDCIRTTGQLVGGRCFTCGEYVPYSESQCGHFITRDCKALRYDERNAHLQCGRCNVGYGGHRKAYEANMTALYGGGIIQVFYKKRWQNKKTYSVAELLDLKRKYEDFQFTFGMREKLNPFPFIQVPYGEEPVIAQEFFHSESLTPND